MEKDDHNEKLNFSLKSIFNSSLIVFISIIISKLLTLAYRIVIARIPSSETFSGTEIYGTFNLAILITSFLTSFFSLGLHEGMLRYIPYYRGRGENEKAQFLFRFVFIFTFLTSLISAIFLYFSSDIISTYLFHNSELSVYLKWFSIFIPLATISGVFLTTTRSYERIGWYTFIGNIVLQSAKISILIIMLFVGLRNSAIIFSYNLSYFFVLIASFFVCKHVIKEVFMKPGINKEDRKSIIKEIFNYSWPLIFVSILSFLFFGMDSFMIGILMDSESVGLYNSATPIAGLIMISSNLFMQLFFPLISREFGKNNIRIIKDISKQIVKWVYLINLPFLIIILLFSEIIIKILFGAEYISAGTPLKFMALGIFSFSVFNISQSLVSTYGKSKAVLLNMFISGIVNVILNYFMILKFGIVGAAIATMISYFIWSIISTLQSKYYTTIIPLKLNKMIIISLAAVIPGLILLYINPFFTESILMVLTESIIFLLVYLILIITTGCLEKEDLIIIKSVKDRLTKKRMTNEVQEDF